MRFRTGDDLLAMDVVREGPYLVTVTDGGFAKRTSVDEWSTKGRGGLGVRAMRLVAERGSLVGALVCSDSDEIYAIASNGVVIRTRVAEVRATGRDTMGVSLMGVNEETTVVALALGHDLGDDDSADPEGSSEESSEGSAQTPESAFGEGQSAGAGTAGDTVGEHNSAGGHESGGSDGDDNQ